MINKKNIFAFILSLIILTLFISALQDSNGNIILGMWYNSDSATDTMTITNGENVDFNVYALALGSFLSVNVELIREDGTSVPIGSYWHATQNFNEFGLGSQGDYTITPTEYIGVGSHKIRLTVTSASATDTLELNLNVVAQVIPPPPQNDAPTITSSPVITIQEGQAYSYDVDATDIDEVDDTLTYSLVSVTPSTPAWTSALTINSSTGLITGTAPLVTTNTNYNVIVSVSDGVNSVNQVFDVVVLDSPAPDTTAPVVTVTSPSNTNYDSQITQVAYTATDANLNQCWYSTNLGVTNSTATTCSGTFAINSVEGINRWTVYANDLAGNIGNTLVTFRVELDVEDDDDDDDEDSGRVSYVYSDVEETAGAVVSEEPRIIELSPETMPEKGFFTRLIEAIISFFRWIFS